MYPYFLNRVYWGDSYETILGFMVDC